jgi:hypothetical protein
LGLGYLIVACKSAHFVLLVVTGVAHHYNGTRLN